MSSTFSNLKFELIANGEQSGTWGTTTNTNIGTAIEQAVVGMATLSSGDFTANVATLTLANTNAAQNARALVLNIASGAVSAAGTINVPAIQKPYIIINGSSFTVTVKVSGLTGVAVPAGKRTVVYNNGTDVGSQIDWLASLDAATATLSGNLTLSGGTANGVAYLNGSKVLTTGSALTFDGTNFGVGGAASGSRLHVMSAGGVSAKVENTANTGATYFQAKNTAGSSYLGQDNVGGYLLTDYAAPFLFYINNAEQMRLTNTGLGIGTSSPSYKLDMTVTAANNAGMRIYNSTAGTGNGCGISFSVANGFSSTNQHAAIQAISESSGNTTTALGFYTSGGSNVGNATERMRLDSSGNLGLGVTPSAWGSGNKAFQLPGGSLWSFTSAYVDLIQNGYYNGTSNIYSSTGAASFYRQNAGAHQWFTAPSGTAGNAISFTQAMTLGADGNLLVGTTTSKVAQFGSSATGMTIGAAAYPVLSLWDTSDASWNFCLAQESGTAYLHNVANGPMVFSTNATERARIDSSGNLLVGATSANAQGQVEVTFNGSTKQGINVIDSSAASTSTAMSFIKSAGTRGSITVTATGTLYNVTSDYRLKTVIGPVADAGQRIDALQPVEYTWNADGSRTRGFLAHQFQEVYPSSVTGSKDAVDAEGKPIYQQMQAGGSETIADLVAEIQSLRQRLAAAGI